MWQHIKIPWIDKITINDVCRIVIVLILKKDESAWSKHFHSPLCSFHSSLCEATQCVSSGHRIQSSLFKWSYTLAMHAAQTRHDWAIVLTLKPATDTSPAKTQHPFRGQSDLYFPVSCLSRKCINYQINLISFRHSNPAELCDWRRPHLWLLLVS